MDFNALQDTLLAPSRKSVANTAATTIESRYSLLSELGSGAYGVVWKAQDNKTDEIFAIKHISKRSAGAKGLKEVMGEVETMSLLNHKNIVKLEETFQDDNNLWIVMEYLPGGELQNLLQAQQCLPETTARRVITQLLMALEYIHDRGIVHRDLKPSNCLLSKNDFIVKISDFGFAVLAGADQCLTTYCGTIGFMAPEILQEVNYGKPVDMWALGVMTYVMFLGEYPFTGDSTAAVRRKICRRGFVSSSAKLNEYPLLRDFISKLLTADPKLRMTAKEALKHPWIKASIDASAKASLHTASPLKDAGNGKCALFRSAVIAVIAAQRLRYLQRCRYLVKSGFGQFSLLRNYRYLVTGTYSSPSSTLDCSHMFSSCPMALLEVFPMIQSCRYLQEVNVSHNNIDNLAVVQGLLKVVGMHPALVSIDLSHNPIPALAGRGLIRLARNPMCRIRRIDVSDTLIPADIASQIAQSLKDKANSSPLQSIGPSLEQQQTFISNRRSPGPQQQQQQPLARSPRHASVKLPAGNGGSITSSFPKRQQNSRRLPPLPRAALSRHGDK